MPKMHRAIWLKTCHMDMVVRGWILAEGNNSAKNNISHPKFVFQRSFSKDIDYLKVPLLAFLCFKL